MIEILITVHGKIFQQLSLLCCVSYVLICNDNPLHFQGVLEDVETLQGNVTQLNDIAKSLLLEAEKEYKEHLDKQTQELNENWQKITDMADNQNNKLKVR